MTDMPTTTGNPPQVDTPPTGNPQPNPAVTTATPPAALETLDAALGAVKPEGEAPPVAEAPAPLSLSDITVPEGLTLDEGQSAKLNEIFALPDQKSQVQALLELGRDSLKSQQEAATAAIQAENDEWIKTIKTDPEVGGAKLDGNLRKVAKMLDAHCDPQLRQALAYTGAGNHPAVIRSFIKLADLLTEGSAVQGKPTAEAPKTLASLMYPDLPTGEL